MHLNRSLGRGLRMLAILNAGGEHRVASLARDVKLPRSTAFRLLCTLVEQGYVWRDPATDIYHPTAHGAGAVGWLRRDGGTGAGRPAAVSGARPEAGLAGDAGNTVGHLGAAAPDTDSTSPLAVVRYTPGFARRFSIAPRARAPRLCGPAPRQMVMDLLYRGEGRRGPPDARATGARLAEIRALGYACMHGPRHTSAATAWPCRCRRAMMRWRCWWCVSRAVPCGGRSSWNNFCRRCAAPRTPSWSAPAAPAERRQAAGRRDATIRSLRTEGKPTIC